MPRATPPTVNVSAASVTSDSVAAGIGHVATVLVGAIAAVFMPRLLGVAHFGHWVLFRTIILLASTTTSMGTMQIMSRFYAPLATTNTVAAGRLFKAVATARLLFGIVAACLGYVLLRLLGGAIFDPTDAALLALAVLFRATAITGSILLYGTTRIRRVTILHFLMGAGVPLWVLGGYLLGGFACIPAACALGEGLVLLAAYGLARPHLTWPGGWPERERLLEVLRFGGHVAPAVLGTGVCADVATCLAAVFGATESQMAFVGLALRLQGMLLAGLMAMNRAILPSLAVATEQSGVHQSLTWVSLLSRTGSVFILGAIGATAFIGRPLIVWIWGPEFLPALVPICLALAATLPMWLAATHVNLAIVLNHPELQLRSVAWLYIGLVAILFGVPIIPIPERTILALMVGAACCMTSLIIGLRRHDCACPDLHRLWGVTVIAILPIMFVEHIADPLRMALVWACAFIAAVLLSRGVRLGELMRIAKHATSLPRRTQP